MSLLFFVAPFPSLLTPVCQALSTLSRSYETADLRYAQCRERRTQWQSTRKRGSILVAEAILELEIRRPLQCHGVKRRTSKHGVVRNDYLMQEVGTSAGPDSESGGPDVCFQRLERPSVTDGSFRPASAVKLSSVFRHGLVKGKAMRDRRVGLHHPQLGEIGVTTSHRAVGCRLTALSDHHISTNPVFL
ncbi:hypothetical protein F4815DRAFT_443216 [Daldinia loculata]|nr:hypothetical protein F4815DRAFT_443216 [Daldinia loculata]